MVSEIHGSLDGDFFYSCRYLQAHSKYLGACIYRRNLFGSLRQTLKLFGGSCFSAILDHLYVIIQVDVGNDHASILQLYSNFSLTKIDQIFPVFHVHEYLYTLFLQIRRRLVSQRVTRERGGKKKINTYTQCLGQLAYAFKQPNHNTHTSDLISHTLMLVLSLKSQVVSFVKH